MILGVLSSFCRPTLKIRGGYYKRLVFLYCTSSKSTGYSNKNSVFFINSAFFLNSAFFDVLPVLYSITVLEYSVLRSSSSSSTLIAIIVRGGVKQNF